MCKQLQGGKKYVDQVQKNVKNVQNHFLILERKKKRTSNSQWIALGCKYQQKKKSQLTFTKKKCKRSVDSQLKQWKHFS